MITSITSAIERKKSVKFLRGASGSRVRAKAKTAVKTIKGKIWSLAAAEIGLVGMIERANWPNVGISPTSAGAADNAARRAAALSPGIGKAWSSRGVRKAASIAPDQSTAKKSRTARAASLLARAASADAA